MINKTRTVFVILLISVFILLTVRSFANGISFLASSLRALLSTSLIFAAVGAIVYIVNRFLPEIKNVSFKTKSDEEAPASPVGNNVNISVEDDISLADVQQNRSDAEHSDADSDGHRYDGQSAISDMETHGTPSDTKQRDAHTPNSKMSHQSQSNEHLAQQVRTGAAEQTHATAESDTHPVAHDRLYSLAQRTNNNRHFNEVDSRFVQSVQKDSKRMAEVLRTVMDMKDSH